MSQAEELLDSLSEGETATYALTPDEEPHIIINPDKSITVPDELKEIAVQFDHDVKTVTFDCPRYWDGRDLFSMHLYINYQRPDGVKAPYPVEDLRLNDEDESIIHFDWTIEDDVTKVNGNITFLVCGKIANSEGELERHWNSKPNQDLIVVAGMDCVDAVLERYPDVIEKILADLDTSVKLVKEAVFTVNGQEPDENGNVEVEAGGIKTVNGQEPDANGNVEVTAGVQSDMYETNPESMAFVRNNPLDVSVDEVNIGSEILDTKTADLGGGENTYYQLSKDVLQISDVIGKTVKYNIKGLSSGIDEENKEIVITQDMIMDMSGYGLPMFTVQDTEAGNAIFMVVSGDLSALGVPLAIGVWAGDFNGSPTVIELSYICEKTQLKPSLLPPHKHKWDDLEDAICWDRSKSEPLNLVFNGNVEDYETVDMDGMFAVKVSDSVLTMDDLISGSVVMVLDGEESATTLTSDNVVDGMSVMGAPVLMVGEESAFVVYGDASAAGLPLSLGVWFMYLNENNHTKSLSNPNATITTTEIKKIDNKYINAEWMATNDKARGNVIIPETTDDFTFIGSGQKVKEPYDELRLVPGNEYFVIWDGIEYLCKANELANEDFHVVYIGSMDDSGEFPFQFNNINMSGLLVGSYATGTHSYAIYDDTGFTAVPLPEKFLPDHKHKWEDIENQPFGESEQVLLSLENAEFTFSEGSGRAEYYISGEPPFTLENGKEYTVIWDGVEYKCTGIMIESNGISFGSIGNTRFVNGNDSGEPFVYCLELGHPIVVDLTATETVSHDVIIKTTELKKLDDKFMPDNVKSDWNQNDPNAIDYVKNRTHYEEKTYTQLWTNAVFTTGNTKTSTASDGRPYEYYRAPQTFEYSYINSSSDDEYIVTVDGVDYEVSYRAGIGENEYIEGKVPVIIGQGSQGSMCIYGREPNKTYTISVKKHTSSSIMPLDEKFIPDTIARTSDIPEVPELSNVAVSGSYNDLSDTPNYPIINVVAKNKISINDVVYIVKGTSAIGGYEYDKDIEPLLSGRPDALSFSPDGKLLVAAGTFTGRAKLYSVEDNTITFVSDIYADNSNTAFNLNINAAAFSHDGTKLVLGGSFPGYAKLYSVDANTVTYVSDIQANNGAALSSYATSAAFSPDGTKLILGGNKYAILYSVNGTDITYIKSIQKNNSGDSFTYTVNDIAFTSDSKFVLIGTKGSTCVSLYSVTSNNLSFIEGIKCTSVNSEVDTISISPDNSLVVIGGDSEVGARLYKLSDNTITEIGNIYADDKGTSFVGTVRKTSFSPDGKTLLVVGSFTGCAKLYSVKDNAVTYSSDIYADSNGTALTMAGTSAAISPDGTKLVLGGSFPGYAKLYTGTYKGDAHSTPASFSDTISYKTGKALSNAEIDESFDVEVLTDVIKSEPIPPISSFILTSSTEGSSKQFRITVDDSGTLSAVEV